MKKELSLYVMPAHDLATVLESYLKILVGTASTDEQGSQLNGCLLIASQIKEKLAVASDEL